MQRDCMYWKPYYNEANKFLLSTKELFVEFVAESIAMATASFQKLLKK